MRVRRWLGRRGTFITYGATSVIALFALGRGDGFVSIPVELRDAAWALGLPASIDTATLRVLGACLALGIALGIGVLVVRRRRGKMPIGLRYRSPAAWRAGDAAFPVVALSLAAGVAEEAFFRLTLPLLVAACFGSGLAGILVGWIAFVALHRHQGVVGMLAVGLVGAALTLVYLATGRLWVVMFLHVVIDLNALLLRPWLTRPPTP